MIWDDSEIFEYLNNFSARSLSDSVENVRDFIINGLDTLSYMNIQKYFHVSSVILDKSIRDFFSEIVEIANNYEKGNMASAFNDMKDLLFPSSVSRYSLLKLSKLYRFFDGKPNLLYRIRVNDKYHLYTREEMFHVPMEKRYLLGNFRYSINGFPCLYLGASLYDCWEETRRPDLDKMNYAAFRWSRPLTVMVINPITKINNIRNLKQFILSLLCSIPVKNDEKKFKYEYVFPELVLHSLIAYNESVEGKKENGEKAGIEIDGIWYLSSHYFTDSMYKDNREIMMNLVIPIKNVDVDTDKPFCDNLVRIFRVSETNTLFKDRLSGHVFGDNKTRVTSYQDSLFNLMEKDLALKRDFKKVENSYH